MLDAKVSVTSKSFFVTSPNRNKQSKRCSDELHCFVKCGQSHLLIYKIRNVTVTLHL
jgi:hypothetical protein